MADDANSENQTLTIEDQRKVGRPLLFETVELLEAKINEYFQSREPFIAKTRIKVMKADGKHFWQDDEELIPARPKTMSGLARALDCDRKTLLNYKGRPEFFPTIARALAECEEYAEEQLHTGRNAHGAQFSLKNNFSWLDESTVNNKNTVVEDLDNLDDEKGQIAEDAAAALEQGQDEPGSTPPQ